MMGSAYYPSLERDIPDFDPALAISGKALARHQEELDAVAERLGLPALFDFYSESTAEAFETIGEEVPLEMEQIPAQWYEPVEAIPTIDALASHVKGHPAEFPDCDLLLGDLSALRGVLEKAQEHRIRFRLRIDI